MGTMLKERSRRAFASPLCSSSTKRANNLDIKFIVTSPSGTDEGTAKKGPLDAAAVNDEEDEEDDIANLLFSSNARTVHQVRSQRTDFLRTVQTELSLTCQEQDHNRSQKVARGASDSGFRDGKTGGKGNSDEKRSDSHNMHQRHESMQVDSRRSTEFLLDKTNYQVSIFETPVGT